MDELIGKESVLGSSLTHDNLKGIVHKVITAAH